MPACDPREEIGEEGCDGETAGKEIGRTIRATVTAPDGTHNLTVSLLKPLTPHPPLSLQPNHPSKTTTTLNPKSPTQKLRLAAAQHTHNLAVRLSDALNPALSSRGHFRTDDLIAFLEAIDERVSASGFAADLGFAAGRGRGAGHEMRRRSWEREGRRERGEWQEWH